MGLMDETLKLLVIDDDEVDRMAVRRALGKTNLEVDLSEAEDGEAALSLLKNQQFDCIFVDFLLPDRDGLSLAKQLQRLQVDTPFVVLTGQGDEQIAVDVMKAGAADYLAKHRITPTTLARTIRSAIRLHRAEQAARAAKQKLQITNDQLRQQNEELAHHRAQIEAQNQELIKAYRLKSEFIATISHELRTPMNAIMGFSQLLLRQYPDPLSEQQLDMVQRIFDNSRNLLTMVNEVLDFSKIEANRLELHPEPFQLSVPILATIQELQALAVEKALTLKAEIPETLQSIQLTNDPECLRRVLVNLISNAIKFTEAGEVTLQLHQPQPDQIKISVVDTGIGMTPEQLSTIFDPFCQADQSLTRHHSGTGLGLAITESLVKAMQGQISVSSQPGVGSTFTVELPLQVQTLPNAKAKSSVI
ncbi:two-component hybrid histidine kinase sensor and regulator [Acaryochloris marina MBIC11017]|uniref:Circadian input-output histidine kinase CikA n=2 Tax=Acaryochloris marina TaxID=155978 RepID=B0C746_ACAM1|nr:two-component hybrid histidine kinase sensor and regulator [Acaryochloris marina MBIC11017]